MSESTQTKETSQSTAPDKQCFRALDIKNGTFLLYDWMFECDREWKIREMTPIGARLLWEELLDQGQKLDLPEGFDKKDPAERVKMIQKALEKMDQKEQMEYLEKTNEMSSKQITFLTAICEPQFEMPIKDKRQTLLSCLCDQADPAKINAFFLIRFYGSTTSPEDSHMLYEQAKNL